MKKATIELFLALCLLLRPPPRLTLSEWADKYRYLSRVSSARPGKWHTSNAPYQKEIIDAITDAKVPKVVIMSGAQVGKTDAFILNTVGYYVQYDPCSILAMTQTQGMGEAFSRDRLTPMLEDTPVLRGGAPDKKW